ncbi:unnamed protein product [Dicrocoelium dendriticum]|nr:unnamed protein product [Dicrocoelium dendriticum]
MAERSRSDIPATEATDKCLADHGAEEERASADKPIQECITRILQYIRQIKSQIGCFHQFINVEPLKKEFKTLTGLLRAGTNRVDTCDQDKIDGSRGQTETSVHRQSKSAIPIHDVIASALALDSPSRKPTIYKTLQPVPAEVVKGSKAYGRAKVNVPDIWNPPAAVPEGHLLPPMPNTFRLDIMLASRYLCLLESLMRLTQESRKSALQNPINCAEDGKYPLSLRLQHARQTLNRLIEAADRINGRKHVDRILIHLRRRSTAKSIMYMIDQERHRKAPWRM